MNTFRISKSTNFELLRDVACNFWGIDNKSYELYWEENEEETEKKPLVLYDEKRKEYKKEGKDSNRE